MSRENDIHALGAAMIDALNERHADALLALIRPDYEFHSRLVAVEGRAYRGREGFQTSATWTKASRTSTGPWTR